MSFGDYKKLDVEKYLEKYGDISISELLEILEKEEKKIIRK